MSICQMLCTTTTKVWFCSTGRNLCTEAEVLIKCNVMLRGALHPSTTRNNRAKHSLCQTRLNQDEENLAALNQDWKRHRSSAYQVFTYVCTINCF